MGRDSAGCRGQGSPKARLETGHPYKKPEAPIKIRPAESHELKYECEGYWIATGHIRTLGL